MTTSMTSIEKPLTFDYSTAGSLPYHITLIYVSLWKILAMKLGTLCTLQHRIKEPPLWEYQLRMWACSVGKDHGQFLIGSGLHSLSMQHWLTQCFTSSELSRYKTQCHQSVWEYMTSWFCKKNIFCRSALTSLQLTVYNLQISEYPSLEVNMQTNKGI